MYRLSIVPCDGLSSCSFRPKITYGDLEGTVNYRTTRRRPMRTHVIAFLTLFLLSSSITLAGEIFGTLREGGKAVAKGVKVDIVTPKKTYTTATDAYGSYRLYVAEKGKCVLNVYYKNQTPSF